MRPSNSPERSGNAATSTSTPTRNEDGDGGEAGDARRPTPGRVAELRDRGCAGEREREVLRVHDNHREAPGERAARPNAVEDCRPARRQVVASPPAQVHDEQHGEESAHDQLESAQRSLQPARRPLAVGNEDDGECRDHGDGERFPGDERDRVPGRSARAQQRDLEQERQRAQRDAERGGGERAQVPGHGVNSGRSSPWMNRLAGVHVASPPRHAGSVSSPIGAGGTSTVYEILVRGELSEALASTLGARRFEPREGMTLVVVEVIDQAHLHGILEQLRDLAIDIERVNPV